MKVARKTIPLDRLEFGGGRIYESLHGFIHLTAVEKALINSPYLQRLRYIKQLGLANLVFPGAEHTRFSHSLGVMWVIDRISRHLQLSAHEQQTLRLAALLHDVGHFPLSHTLEAAYRRKEKEAAKKQTADYVIPSGSHRKALSQSSRPAIPLQRDAKLHERLSAFIIENTSFPGGVTEILKAHDCIPNEIAAIVVGASDRMLFNQLMHSDIDADQMDYLLRDASCLGIGYGQFAIEYLIECFTIQTYQGRDILCIREKGTHTVDHYLLAKYFYYLQILYHKKRWLIEEAAERLYWNILLAKRSKHIPQYDALPVWVADPEKWRGFDDTWVMNLFREAESCNWLPDTCSCLFDIVLRRQLPSWIHEKIVNCQKKDLELPPACRKAMKDSVSDAGNSLADPAVGISCLEEQFDFVKSLAERRDEKDHRDDVEALRNDRDIIRIFRHSGEIVPIGQESSSLAQSLEDLRTYVFRAYKLKTDGTSSAAKKTVRAKNVGRRSR